ncbi:hypothetical protein U1839_23805 [Sphingomonas sp. RT2P30]|uniref:hypothetical protein n=1 Tax=Parasphingomonas halimpatiens TaxID=3096162 RepID=UPI002FC92E9F
MDSDASEYLDPLAFRVGETTVGDNLNKAVAAGRLIAHADGTWEVSERKPSPKRWLGTKVPWHVPCETMLRLIFTNAYDRKQVPWHCRNCYKVKARPRSMRQLLALGRLLKATKWTAKYGLNVASSANQGGYAAYVYLDGLDAARRAYHQLRAQMEEVARFI